MNKNSKTKYGFTLTEAAISLALFGIAMALAFKGYLFLLQNYTQDNKQNELDIKVQMAIERIKHDLRLSSLGEIYFHVDSNGVHKALSFPLGELDDNGILKKDSNGDIAWTQQVIYHIKSSSTNQLVRTVFTERLNLSSEERIQQMTDVVEQGDGSTAENSANYKSSSVFFNLLNWELSPSAGKFDGYAETYGRKSASLGYAVLSPGTHTLTFKTVEPSDGSSRYDIGIDHIYTSASASPREGETLNIIDHDIEPIPVFTKFGSYSGKHLLQLDGTAAGQSFSVSVTNDLWKETNFTDSSGLDELNNTESKFDLILLDDVVRLEGMDTAWTSEQQTRDYSGYDAGATASAVVRIHLNGKNLSDYSGSIKLNGQQCKLTFAASTNADFSISHIYIGESASSSTLSMEYASAPTPVEFEGATSATIPQGTSRESDWIDLEIDKNKNYLVSFYIVSGTPKEWIIGGSAAFQTAMINSGGLSSSANDITMAGSFTNRLPGLESMFVSYPSSGTYISRPFDTNNDDPAYTRWSINKTTPGTSAITMQYRTASSFAYLDTATWKNTPTIYDRYIQFKATLSSDSDGQDTPILHDSTIQWDGEEKLIDIGGTFTTGPELGVFEVEMDGNPLSAALVVDLEIYETIRGLNGQDRRISSSLKVDLTPRNTGKSTKEQ